MNSFYSPTYGSVPPPIVREKVLEFMACSKEHVYELIIGTDSHPKNGSGAAFVAAVTIHRIGQGGIYFYRRYMWEKSLVLQARIYQEVSYSLELADELLTLLKNDGISKVDVEIHVDVGKNGKTKDYVSDVVGMIEGSGFRVKTKPYSFGASKVADRHT